MSIQSNFPAIAPSLNLNFAQSKVLDPRITFTRASTATVYDGKTVSKAEENLLTYSQEFNNAAWSKGAASISANSTTSPDGTTTADTLLPNAGSTSSWVGQAPAITATNTVAYVDLTTGAVNAVVSAFDTITVVETPVGSGWWRIAGTRSGYTLSVFAKNAGYNFVALQLNTNTARFYAADSSSALSSADGTSGVYLWGAQLEQRSSVTAYTPTTTQPITNYIPVLQTAAANVARFQHSPTTFESQGFFVEEQRSNLLTYSEDFANAAWTKVRGAIASNVIVAPDGTLTGDLGYEDTSTNTHNPALQDVTITANATYTTSMYFKAQGRFRGSLQFSSIDSANYVAADFNLTTGTVATSSLGTGSGAAATITPVGNSWYRVTITGAIGSSLTAGRVILRLADASGNIGYTGDGYSGIYIWGAQLEAGTFPTSYIKTEASQVTRSADAASMTGANFSSWYRADEGTLYAEFIQPYPVSSHIMSANDSTTGNRISLRNSGTIPDFLIQTNTSTQAQLSVSTVVANVPCKSIGAYKYNDASFAANSVLSTQDATVVLPTVNQLSIGSIVGTAYLNGTIKKLAFYSKRLTNAQLQALTS